MATVPSMIFSSACCTPSPETSRVMDGFFRLPADLVDLVDVDDSPFGPLNVVIRILEQLEDDVLHVLADIPGFGEGGGVHNGERNVQDARHGLRQQGLAGTGRPDEQDIALLDLDVVEVHIGFDPLVMVMDGDGKNPLRHLLADHEFIQHGFDLFRLREMFHPLGLFLCPLLYDDVVAQIDALVANKDRRPGDELFDLVIALSAKRALQGLI